MTPMAVSQLPPISTQRSPSAPPPPPADGPLPPPTPQSSLSGPLRTSQPSSPSRLSQIPQLNGKEQTSAGQPETTRRVREKRKAALAKFTEVLQAVLIAHTKLNIAQNVVKRAGPIYTSTDTHYDEDLIRDLYRDESNAKAELKTAHDDFEAVYDTLVYNNAFDESADDVLAALDQRLGISEHQQKMVNLERANSTTEDAIGALQMRANTLQVAVDALQAKLDALDADSANEAPRVDTDQVMANVAAEFAKRQADVVMREPDPPVKQSQSVPPSPLPSPPASAQANGTITQLPPMEDSKRGRARQMLQDLVDRVDILEIEQSISTAQIDELKDTVSDFMSDCASVTRSVLRKMMRGDGTDQSRETLAAELRKIIRLVNGEDSVAPATRPVQSDELAAAPNSSSAVADAEGLKSEVKASLKAEIKAELMAELKAQIKAELKEETKAEIRAEVQHEYHTLITELQEKVEFLETGMSSQISSMYQEFREYRNSSK